MFNFITKKYLNKEFFQYIFSVFSLHCQNVVVCHIFVLSSGTRTPLIRGYGGLDLCNMSTATSPSGFSTFCTFDSAAHLFVITCVVCLFVCSCFFLAFFQFFVMKNTEDVTF